MSICSNERDAKKHLTNLIHFLTNRGHSAKKVVREVDRAIQRYKNTARPLPHSPTSIQFQPTLATQPVDLFEQKGVSSSTQNPKPQRIPLVLTYHPGLPDISSIIKRFLPVLHLNPDMKQACPDPPLVAFRKPKSLRDFLIKAKVHSPRSKTDPCPSKPSCDPCSTKGIKRGRKCLLCMHLPEQTYITSSTSSKQFSLRLSAPADCDSLSVVYCITCKQCKEVNQYVGETGCFRKRMNNHKSHIRLGKEDDQDCRLLYNHFKHPGHSIEDMKFTILELCPDSIPLRRESELRWMWTLQSITPFGLTIRH